MTTPLTLAPFAGWLAAGERGLSSEAIVSHLTDHRVGSRFTARRVDHPHDPSDFRRCQLLLANVPVAKLMFPMMRTASPQWERLVDAWDEIDALCRREVPDYLSGRSPGEAPLAHRLMRRVISGGTKCETCDGSGRADACSECNGTGRRCGGRCWAQGCHKGYGDCATCRGYGYTDESP